MSDHYHPLPEHRFTFGLWTVGNIGRDPFGKPVRNPLTLVELVRLMAEVGAYVGLTVCHTRAHLTRAVLEGVAFGIKDSFMLIQGAVLGAIRQVRVSGGGACSAL